MMAKELKYEFSSQEQINKCLNCLKTKMDIISEEMEESGGLKIKSPSRSLILLVLPTFTEEQKLTIFVQATTTDKDAETIVKTCFGKPKSERKLAPSILEISKAIIQSSKQNLDLLSEDVCERFGLNPKQFDRYRKMIDQSASMPGALSEVKMAAEKLKKL